jgi:hypothetical protein
LTLFTIVHISNFARGKYRGVDDAEINFHELMRAASEFRNFFFSMASFWAGAKEGIDDI